MEPANLIPSPDDEARLAAFVRQNLPPLPDAGFSARVLAALPPPRVRSFPLIELALTAAGAVVGIGFALAQGDTTSGTVEGLARLRSAASALAGAIDGSSLGVAALLAFATVLLGVAVARLPWPGARA